MERKSTPKIIRYGAGKEKPEWIKAHGFPKNAKFLGVDVIQNKTARIHFYQLWNARIGMFVPVNFSSKSFKSYYNDIAKEYDWLIKNSTANIKSGQFILNYLKRLQKNKNAEILDLGAGTGIITEMFANEGYKNLTLVDFSKGMLSKARKRKSLEGCTFIQQDIRKLKLKKKYDVAMSFFSLGLQSYFSEQDTLAVLSKIKKCLKKNGLFMLLGFYDMPKKNPFFRTIGKGRFIAYPKKGYYFDWYIGRKY